jgi:hypothetical protein
MNEEQNRAFGRAQQPATKQDIYKLEQRIAALEPVKKTEKKSYALVFAEHGKSSMVSENLDLTPTTAHKLSEAISALVEYVTQDYPVYKNREILMSKINEAHKSFQESQ